MTHSFSNLSTGLTGADRSGLPAARSPAPGSSAPRPELSVVIPVYNEVESLPRLLPRLQAVLAGLGLSHEIIFVDDGSRDGSRELLANLVQQHPEVRACLLSRNFGHEAASTCGLDHARGRAAILMDADLQDPPELIAEFVAHWQAGAQLVVAQRRQRLGEPWHVLLTSYLFYRGFRWMTGIDIPVDTGDFRLMDRTVLRALQKLPDRVRYVRGLTHWAGYRQVAIPFDRQPRVAGQTKYNFSKRFRLAMDAFTGFSDFLPRTVLPTGVVAGLAAVCGGMLQLVGQLWGSLPGWTWLVWWGLALASVQLVALGIVAEYVGRTLSEVRRRPIYLVERRLKHRAAQASLPVGCDAGQRRAA